MLELRSGEMRRLLYYGHPKFGQVRLPTNAATNFDFFLTILDSKHVKPPLQG